MSNLDPVVIFDLIEAHVPKGLLGNILVVGSLAAAYEHRNNLPSAKVNTKDADIIIHPAGAITQAQQVAQQLLDAHWRRVPQKCRPWPESQPVESLSVIRLNPPDSDAYFIELLGFPHGAQQASKGMVPIQLRDGWYVLPVFRYLGVTEFGRKTAHNGLTYAAPEMMALSNLLSHREIGTARISETFTGRKAPLRAAKDLGRVLALARLASRSETEAWPARWLNALRERFPAEAKELATHAGDGLRALLEDREAFDDAHYTVNVGLLAGKGVTQEQLVATGRQVLADALEPLAALAG